MKSHRLFYLCAASMLSGCATEANFSKALEAPVKAANAAKVVVIESERDAEKARAMGWIVLPDKPATPEELVCGPVSGVGVTLRSLSAFGEALELIKEVGEKPADTSYAGYVKQYRKNKASLAAARAMNDEQAAAAAAEEAKKLAKDAHTRCVALYLADMRGELKPRGLAGEKSAEIKALSTLIKGIAALAEGIQRERAVRETAIALIPGMRTAHGLLGAAPNRREPHVEYNHQADTIAAAMAQTRLGAAVNVRRWFVAQQINAGLANVQGCAKACLGDPLKRMALENLANDLLAYRALAAIDTDKVLAGLGTGIRDAQHAAESKGSWAEILDGLLGAADAIDGLKTNWEDYKTARD